MDLYDRRAQPMAGASGSSEGKIHLGLVYARDPRRLTHRLLIRGALSFASALREIADLVPSQYIRGARFHYAVPVESGLTPDAIEDHFQAVEEQVLETQRAEGGTYLGRRLDRVVRRLSQAELAAQFAPEAVQAAFVTEEEAIDTLAMAALLRQAIAAHPRVRFFADTHALGGAIEPDGVVLELDNSAGRRQHHYPVVINCLWAGRLAFDAALGLTPEQPWLFRFKAVLRARAPELSTVSVPTSTLVHGPFGDVVDYGGGYFYLSWYPRFKLAETRDLNGAHLDEALDHVDRQAMAREGVLAMARYVPGVARLLESERAFEVAGGVIFSWGSTDIDDPDSGLHERWQIGPQRHGPYITVNTGKYTTAPRFALDTCRWVDEILQ